MFDKGINIKSQLHKSKICLGSLFRWLFKKSYSALHELQTHSDLCLEKVYLFWKNTCFRKFRGSLPEVFCKNDVLKGFAKFTEKHLCQCLFNKVAGLSEILKKTSFYRTLPVEVPRTEIIIFAKNFHHKYVIGS